MKCMKKWFALLTACLVLALTLTACTAAPATSDKTAAPANDQTAAPANEGTEQTDWDYISGKGTLVIGYTVYEPMNYPDETGKLVGFDTEFAEALCEKLGVTPDFVEIDWDSKELELSSKKIDCIWNGLTVSEERRANMDFSSSYLKNEQTVVIRTADAEKFVDLASFDGASVVAEEGSAGAATIEADMPSAAFTGVLAQSDALLEVKAGTADAAVIDVTMANAMVGEGTDYADLMIVTGIDLMDEEYAVGFRLGSDVTAKANEAISALLSDGTLKALAEKYDLSDLLIG